MKVAVIGVGQTTFGEHWDKSLTDLLACSQLEAIKNAGIKAYDIDAIFTGNMCAPIFSNQANIGVIASHILNVSIPSVVVEGACASGGLAIRAGISAIESGQARIVLVNGIEKMTDVSLEQATRGLSAASSAEWEQIVGATFPALNALIARLYLHTYGFSREQLAAVSVQNHEHGLLNKIAHIRRRVTVEQVVNAPIIADPLTLFDCSPISDGSASIILCDEETAKRFNNVVYIVGSGHATDSLLLSEREDFLTWKATQIAGQMAYEMAQITPSDVDVVEVHDGFSITQVMALEDLSFFKKGEALKAIEDGLTGLRSSRMVVNPSGGLKSRGHPIGATGVAQAIEIVRQLRGECGERQVQGAKTGLIHNAGGCGSNVVVHILRSEVS